MLYSFSKRKNTEAAGQRTPEYNRPKHQGGLNLGTKLEVASTNTEGRICIREEASSLT